MTKEKWSELEDAAFAEANKDENPIGHPVELARYLTPRLLTACGGDREMTYNAAKEHADEKTRPHIACRLNVRP